MPTRRSFIATMGAGLALGPLALRRAEAQPAIPALELIEPLGEPSVIWTAFDFLRPILERELGVPVTQRTVTGDHNLNAARAVLEGSSEAVRLFGCAVMATQYAGRSPEFGFDLETMTPVAKLSNGFSIAFFARAGAGIASWEDAAARAAEAPLRVSCLPNTTAAFVAMLMAERRAGLAMEATLRATISEVIADVMEGRADAGFVPTALVARDRANLAGLATFGAERNAVLAETPTFGEIAGNRKLSFTESVAAFAAPGTDPATVVALVAAFVAAGQAPEILDTQESALFPVVVNGPDVLVQTLARNNRVLDDILA